VCCCIYWTTGVVAIGNTQPLSNLKLRDPTSSYIEMGGKDEQYLDFHTGANPAGYVGYDSRLKVTANVAGEGGGDMEVYNAKFTVNSQTGFYLDGALADQDQAILGQTQLGNGEPFYKSIFCQSNGTGLPYALALPTLGVVVAGQRYCIATDIGQPITLGAGGVIFSGSIAYTDAVVATSNVAGVGIGALTYLTLWSCDNRWFYSGTSGSVAPP
jgi:hypothetical protein